MAVSFDNYTGDGSTVDFNLTFEYRKESEINVSINDIANTDWTLSTATKITFDVAPEVDAEILIYRTTDLTSMDAVFAPGSAIRAKDLNDDFDQLRLAIQEGVDYTDQNESDINALDIRVTQNEADITALDVRVTQNESDISDLQQDISDINTDASALEARVTQNETDIAKNASDITALDADLTSLGDDVAQNTTDIANNTANIAVNATNIATNVTNIAQNTADIDELKKGGGGSDYVLPTASSSTLGGIKVGANLSIDANGVLSSTASGGGGGAVDSVNGQTGAVVLGAADVGALQAGDNVSELTNDAGYLANGDNVSELVNDAGYVTSSSAPVTSVNGQTGEVLLDASDLGAITDITGGLGIKTAGTTISLDNGAGIEFDGNKAILGNLDQVKDVIVSGIQAGEVLKWNSTSSQWQNSPEIAVPGALVFVGQIDATTQYPPAADIISGHFWVTNKPDKDTGKTAADAQWTTVDQSVTPHVQGPTLEVQYGDMIAVGAEHDISGTMVRNHVVFGNVVTGTTIGIQPGDNVSLLVNDANYTSEGDNISVFNNDAGYVTAGDVPSAPGNGVLTLKLFGQSGDNQTGTFSANQGNNTTITLPQIDFDNLVNKPDTPNNGQINVNGGDGITASGSNATANQSGNTTRTLAVDTTWLGTWIDTNKPGDISGNGALTIQTAGEGASATGTFTANQSGPSTLTLPTIRYQDLSGKPTIPASPGNGTLTIKTAGEGANATGTFTANQGSNSTLTLPAIRWADISGKPSVPAAANNGQINISGGDGLTASGSNATANQSGNTTRTLAVDNSVIRTSGNQTMGGTKTFTGIIGLSSTSVINLESLPSLP